MLRLPQRIIFAISLATFGGPGLLLQGTQQNKAATEISPPYSVTVRLSFSSPFVPDGRMSLAEFSLRAVFSAVTLEFDPGADELLGRCQVNAEDTKGTITSCRLNDVQQGEVRYTPWFIQGPPKDFSAGLEFGSELSPLPAKGAQTAPPRKISLAFEAQFMPPVEWGSIAGSNLLSGLKVEFEVPFRDLLAGKPSTVSIPYEGSFSEDRGTWQVEFKPAAKRK